jgi:signal transduction histidine kinase
MVADSAMLSQLSQGIYSGAIRMHEIVNTMLDIAKIDNSALELSPEPLEIAALIRNVLANFESAIKQRRINLTLVEGLAGLPRIEGDVSALGKVFYQLISNSLKYTPDGGKISLAGEILPASSELPDGGIQIVVSDTGIGIDPTQIELIFTKFYQTGEVALHSSGRTKFKGGGPGLGLPIARGIIQAHNGKLWAASPGYDEVEYPGSQFYIVLPLRQKAPSPNQGSTLARS